MKYTAVVNYQKDMEEVLQAYTPRTRLLVGLFACAALAHFVPVLFLVVVGKWVNQVLSFVSLAVTILFLILLNLLGNKLKRVWLVNSGVALLYTAWCFHLMAQQAPNIMQGLKGWWATFAWFIMACMLNAALFVHYKKMADLD